MFKWLVSQRLNGPATLSKESFKNFRRPNCRSVTRKFKGKTRYLFISLSPYYIFSPKAKKNSEEIQCYEVLLVNPWGQVGLREKKAERKKWKNVKGPFYSDESFISSPPPPPNQKKKKKKYSEILWALGGQRRSSPTAAILWVSPKNCHIWSVSFGLRVWDSRKSDYIRSPHSRAFFLAYIKNT